MDDMRSELCETLGIVLRWFAKLEAKAVIPVRYKDCKHWERNTRLTFCKWSKEDDYCSLGEMKEVEDGWIDD